MSQANGTDVFDEAELSEQDFLAREQALLGDDAALFNVDSNESLDLKSPIDSTVTVDTLNKENNLEPELLSSTSSYNNQEKDIDVIKEESKLLENEIAAGFIPNSNNSSNLNSPFNSSNNNNKSNISSTINNKPESDKIKEWKLKFEKKINEKDANSRSKHDKILLEARKSLERFYSEYNDKKNKIISKNKENEDYQSNLRSGKGSIWESVLIHIESQQSNQQQSKSSSIDVKSPIDKRSNNSTPITSIPNSVNKVDKIDKSRMKEVFMNLK